MPTDADIARWRLRSQSLVDPRLPRAADVVGSLLAVQAENPAQSAWAVAARTTDPHAGDLAEALAEGRVLRTHVMRPTWHYVTADDARWLLELTAPRIRPVFRDQLHRLHGLDDTAVDRLAALVQEVLSGGRTLTRPQLAHALEEAGHPLSGQALMHLLGELELRALLCSGPPVGEVHSYALLSERVGSSRRLEREEALAELALRYATGHGPATVDDLAYWATLTRTDARAGLSAVADRLERFEHDGRTFWHAPGESPPTAPQQPEGHLLQVLDETYRGYQDSRWVIDAAGVVPRVRETAIGMALVDGQLVAAMKRTLTQRQVAFELRPHPSWSSGMLPLVQQAAAAYGAFLGREPVVRVLAGQ